MPEIAIPALLAHQAPVAASAVRNKVVRAGRRWGKSRLAFNISIMGHSGGRGVADGGTVVWLAPDFPQATSIWREEVEPRFRGVAGIRLNQQEHTVTLPHGGMLSIRSAEAVEGIRGLGKTLTGIVVDEAAHQDLEYALRNVLRPALLDNQGWLLLVSTPFAGSYFNTLCQETLDGQRGPEWAHWHGTPYDNPILARDEIAALIAEYPPDSLELRQEVFAELLQGGAGLAFPEWRTDLHVTQAEPAAHARWFGGLDWGYTSDGCFTLFASEGERVQCRYDMPFRGQTPYSVGQTIGLRCREWPLKLPEWIGTDSACWQVTDGGPTIAEELQRGIGDVLGTQAPVFISAPKGTGSRVTRKLLLHQYLRYESKPDGSVPAWMRPRLTFHRDAGYCIKTIPALPRDPKKPEDVDTTALDHGYDSGTYALMAREPAVERPEPPVPLDVHPGYTASGRRRNRDRSFESRVEEEVEAMTLAGVAPGGRYGRRR